MAPPLLSYNETADRVIGSILCLCSGLGIIFNTTSFLYFITKPLQNNNARYYRSIYLLISSVDLLICITLFPYIDSAFTQGREGKLFLSSQPTEEVEGDFSTYKARAGICSIWAVLWKVLPELSVFLVGFISVSRLLLLRTPTRQFNPVLAWIIPAGYCISTLLFKTSLLLTGTARVLYKPSLMSCEIIVHFTAGPGERISTTEWRWELVLRSMASVQSGMTVIPISLSCVLSVFYLLRAERRADEMCSSAGKQNGREGAGKQSRRGGVTKQREATLTVIIVTTIYVMFNIPAIMYYIYLARWSAATDPTNVTKEGLRESHQQYFNTDFQRKYMWVVFSTLFTALNSLANPLVYFSRIRGFREFVTKGLRRNKQLIGHNIDLVFLSHVRQSRDGTEENVLENIL